MRLYIWMLIIDNGKQKKFYSHVLNNTGDIKTKCPPKLNVKERKVPFLN